MRKIPSFIFINDENLSYQRNENVTRSEMDNGLPKTRNKESTQSFTMNFGISIHEDDFNLFYDWMDNEINGGLSWFLLRSPLTGKMIRARLTTNSIQWTKEGTILISSMSIEGYDNV